MLEWLPDDFLMRFGERQDSVLNGQFLHLDPALEDQIAEDLTERGFRVDEDEVLVLEASGH